MRASGSWLARAARRLLGAFVVVCLHAPLIADDAVRGHEHVVGLAEPGDVSPLRVH